MNFSTVPPKRSSSSFAARVVRRKERPNVLGVELLRSAVKPTRSTKSDGDDLALLRGHACASSREAPQDVQKARSGETTVPHSGHGLPRALPQFPQKSAPAGLAEPQAAQEEADMAWLV